MLHRLHIAWPDSSPRIMEVIGTTTIGRASDSDIILEEATVSRCHALLLRDAAGVLLIDLESANGTFVNGVQAPPDEAVRLVDGDLIALGRVTARYSASPNDRDGCSNRRSGRS